MLNSLAQLIGPREISKKFSKSNFQLVLMIDGWSISCKIVLKWLAIDLSDGKSTFFSNGLVPSGDMVYYCLGAVNIPLLYQRFILYIFFIAIVFHMHKSNHTLMLLV